MSPTFAMMSSSRGISISDFRSHPGEVRVDQELPLQGSLRGYARIGKLRVHRAAEYSASQFFALATEYCRLQCQWGWIRPGHSALTSLRRPADGRSLVAKQDEMQRQRPPPRSADETPITHCRFVPAVTLADCRHPPSRPLTSQQTDRLLVVWSAWLTWHVGM